MPVADWVKDIVEDVYGKCPFHAGLRVKHVPTGRIVEITKGQFWGEHGVSSFWYWKPVLPDGCLSELEEHGYGKDLEVIACIV